MGCIDVIIISLLSLFTVKYPAGSGLADYGRMNGLCMCYIYFNTFRYDADTGSRERLT